MRDDPFSHTRRCFVSQIQCDSAPATEGKVGALIDYIEEAAFKAFLFKVASLVLLGPVIVWAGIELALRLA